MGALLLSLALVGCGEDEPVDDSVAETDTDTDADSDSDADADADTDSDADTDLTYDQMDFEQRKTYMQEVVNPEMKLIFQAHDADKYADFGCVTCHGAGANDGTFETPAAELHGLDPEKMPDYGAGFPDTDFMYDTVTPEMAELLHMEPWSEDTPEGFGCFGCHPVKENDH